MIGLVVLVLVVFALFTAWRRLRQRSKAAVIARGNRDGYRRDPAKDAIFRRYPR